MELNESAIVSSLEKLGVKATIQENYNQVVTNLSINEQDYPMFIRCLQGGNLMQMITFIPCTLEESSCDEVGMLCHMINKELDMPGFCCDVDSKTVFYRLVIPCLKQKIDEELFLAYFNTTKQVCTMFGSIIHAVAVKAMTLKDLFEKAKELATANK